MTRRRFLGLGVAGVAAAVVPVESVVSVSTCNTGRMIAALPVPEMQAVVEANNHQLMHEFFCKVADALMRGVDLSKLPDLEKGDD